jgi:hypothetical protein
MRPPSPDSRWPHRHYEGISLAGVVGWTDHQVMAKLGSPDHATHFNRAPRRAEHVFGPAQPRNIRPETPYDSWSYDNVDGSTWVLYLATPAAVIPPGSPEWQRGDGPVEGQFFHPAKARARGLVVIDVTSYPTGAVF